MCGSDSDVLLQLIVATMHSAVARSCHPNTFTNMLKSALFKAITTETFGGKCTKKSLASARK